MIPKHRDIYITCLESTAHQERKFIYYREEVSNEQELSQQQLSRAATFRRHDAQPPVTFISIYL